MTSKKKKIILTISIIGGVLLVLFSYPIFIFGMFFVYNIQYRDRTAKVELDKENSIKIVLHSGNFPDDELDIDVYDKEGKFIFDQDLQPFTDELPSDYIKTKNDSWKTVTFVKEENGIKTYDAIWGTIELEEDGTITITPKEPEYTGSMLGYIPAWISFA